MYHKYHTWCYCKVFGVDLITTLFRAGLIVIAFFSISAFNDLTENGITLAKGPDSTAVSQD